MGALGSKEKLGQFVAIYGYHRNDFSWIDMDSRSVYRGTGIIVNYNGKKYVITTRQKIISCKTIAMYHSYFRGNEPVLRNSLYVIFQSIEYNIIILASENKTELDLSTSEIISGHYVPAAICPSYDMTNDLYVLPTKRSQYHTAKMGMDLRSPEIRYCVDILNLKYISSFIFRESYVPNDLMYKFILKNNDNKSKLVGIYGSIVFNKKNQMVGMISRLKDNELHILPKFAIMKIFSDFIRYHDIPNQYRGLVHLPFTYFITNSKKIKISFATINTESSAIQIEKNDELITINGSDINIIDNDACVYDVIQKENIPIDVFIKLHYDAITPIKLQIRRQNILYNVDFYGITENKPLELTNRSYFYPLNSIPYVNFNGIIMVQLTHELLDVCEFNKIYIKNCVIDKCIGNNYDCDANFNAIIIFDCLNNEIVKKYNLPKILQNKEQEICCPVVTKINGDPVTYLSEFNIIAQQIIPEDSTRLTIMTPDSKILELDL